MILTLEVIGAQAADLGAAGRKIFNAIGGTIGRLPDNDWVFPDPYVSGRHALIRYLNGKFFIEDTSTNGVFVNAPDNRLPRAEPHQLKNGDRLFIDAYEIQVVIEGDPAADSRNDPLAALAASRTQALPPPGRPPKPVEEERTSSLMSRGANRDDDEDEEDDVDSDEHKTVWFGMSEAAEKRAEPPPPAPPPSPPPRAKAEPRAAAPAPAPKVEPPRPAPEPVRPAPEPARPPPEPVRQAAEPARPAPAEPVRPTAEPARPAAAEPVRQAAEPARRAPPPPAPEPPPPPPKAAPAVRPAAAAPPSSAGADEGSQLAILLATAGIPGIEPSNDAARMLGGVLRSAMAGLMDMLRLRERMKDELRMRGTTFKAANNNPLKFSANVDDAFHNLFVKHNPAYLQPPEAVEDAFRDVRDHQAASLAAMRVAFEAALSEFDPDRMQEMFDRQMKKGSILGVPAKLRYWDMYREKYGELIRESDETFRALFGDEFARAYEQQLERLRAAGRSRDK
jgi:predicted component of type VI protein secretion system